MTPRKHISRRERFRIAELHGWVCHFCMLPIDHNRQAWEISHQTPLAFGGADDDRNRRPAHKSCHREHTSKEDIPAIAKADRIAAAREAHEQAMAAGRPRPNARERRLMKMKEKRT